MSKVSGAASIYRLRPTRKLRLAWLALVWEQLWPALWPLGFVLGVGLIAALFDLLFFAVNELPATVPVALTLIILELWEAYRRRRLRPAMATP